MKLVKCNNDLIKWRCTERFTHATNSWTRKIWCTSNKATVQFWSEIVDLKCIPYQPAHDKGSKHKQQATAQCESANSMRFLGTDYTYFRWERLNQFTPLAHPWLASATKMVVSCCAYGCKNRFGEQHGLGFYRFPAVPEARRKEWIRAVKHQDWVPSRYSRICSDHFVSGKLTSSHS